MNLSPHFRDMVRKRKKTLTQDKYVTTGSFRSSYNRAFFKILTGIQSVTIDDDANATK